ncbi:MAG TPA: DUF3606 domain-containing protein [Hanamia sp.]|nr:DUF3606 domain-containing protein [Hanamia sp.]
MPIVAHFKKMDMPDNKNNRGKSDRSRIDISEPYELEYWKKRLGITTDQLKRVIEKVGPMSKDVEAYLADMK